jgi:hypothetical protein
VVVAAAERVLTGVLEVRVEWGRRLAGFLGLLELLPLVEQEGLALQVLVVLVAGKVRRVLLEHLQVLARVELAGEPGITLLVIRLLHTLLQGPV